MLSRIALILLIMPYTASLASDGTVGLYVDTNRRLGLLAGDYNVFDVSERDKMQGSEHYSPVWRYGSGSTRVQVGNQLGMNLTSNSGFAFLGLDKQDRNTIAPWLGLEFLNGRINFNLSSKIQDYYQGFMGPSAGLLGDLGGCKLGPYVKAGGTGGTLGYNGIKPHVNWAYGYGALLNCGRLDATASQLLFKDKYLSDLTVLVRVYENYRIGAHVEEVKGLRLEKSYSILFSW